MSKSKSKPKKTKVSKKKPKKSVKNEEVNERNFEESLLDFWWDLEKL